MTIVIKEKLVQILAEQSRRLNKERIEEVLSFVGFLANRNEDKSIKRGISNLASLSKSFKFLHKEPELYSLKDIR
ncbi:MAG: hypothetical protein AAB371_01840 [Patescibacteria group bacterium]